MVTSSARRTRASFVVGDHDTLARAAGFAAGQLMALHSDHRVFLEFPGLRDLLPADEVRRGREAGQEWISDLLIRCGEDLPPDYLHERGARARLAWLLGEPA
jgi:hypothetical protein